MKKIVIFSDGCPCSDIVQDFLLDAFQAHVSGYSVEEPTDPVDAAEENPDADCIIVSENTGITADQRRELFDKIRKGFPTVPLVWMPWTIGDADQLGLGFLDQDPFTRCFETMHRRDGARPQDLKEVIRRLLRYCEATKI